MSGKGKDLTSMSMMDLFRQEAENHCAILSEHLLALEKNPGEQDELAALMRAAHSIKGAARIMDLTPIVSLTHAMEDVFVAAQKEKIVLDADDIDHLLKGVDRLGGIAGLADEEIEDWLAGQQAEMDALIERFSAVALGTAAKEPAAEKELSGEKTPEQGLREDASEEGPPADAEPEEPVLKISSRKPRTRPKKEFPADLSSMSMMDLFRQEAEIHCATLTDNLLALEKNAEDPEALAALMRAAHSIKGAARVIELHIVVGLAHAMEDVFAVSYTHLTLPTKRIV